MFDAQAFQSGSASSSSAPVSIASANLRPFLDISPDALVIVNPAGTIVLVNGQTEACFGYARDELIGQPLELLQRHGGQLWFESAEGVGSTFFLTLPSIAGQESSPALDKPSVGEHPE